MAIQAFAVYSADDGSLIFYKRENVPSVGDTFNDRIVTKVYTGFETSKYDAYGKRPWDDVRKNVTNVSFVDNISPISLAFWFTLFEKLVSFDGTNLDTSNVTDMSCIFQSCYALKDINVEGFNTNKVTNMRYFITSSNVLTQLNLSSFDTSNVTSMANMFQSNVALKTIYVSDKWNTDNIKNSTQMFYQCTSLVGQSGTTFNSSNVGHAMANYETGYLTLYTPPIFSGENANIGVFSPTKTITYTYTVTGKEGETITVVEAVNGVTINTFDTTSGSEHTLVLKLSDLTAT